MPTQQFTSDEHAVAIIASNILLVPTNMVARMTFNAACHQAITLLNSAKRALAEHVDAGVPEPPTRAETFKRSVRLPDIIPPAVRVTE
jgi:hypothetical protein